MSFRMLIITIVSAILPAGTAMAQAHPNTFVNTSELAAIAAQVQAGRQPWLRAYNETIADANAALSQAPRGVTSQGSTSHEYYTQRPYDWSNNMPSPCGATYCDGHINPEADRADYTTVTTICRAIRDLGLAYALSGDSRYADKAIVLINAWCLDDATYMEPRYTDGQSQIELSITIPGMFYGADLIYNYPGWGSADRSDFLDWATAFTQSAQGWSRTNNFENWRLVVLATGGALTGNQTVLDAAWSRWREIIPDQVSSEGRMVNETGRTKSLDYSTYALNAMLQTAEIARHHGVDLYHYTSSGRGMELVLDYHAPFIASPSTWPYEQISSYTGANIAVYECAYAVWQKQSYMDVINRWGRPMYESRVMGYTTLTHAFGLDVTPVAMMPRISPDGGEHVGAVQVSLSCTTPDARIYYTTDGSTPDESDARYSAPFTLSSSVTVKAIAFADGVDPSAVATADFTITLDTDPPDVQSVSSVFDSTRVRVVFSEMVDAVDAEDAGNYAIAPGIAVTSATLLDDNRTVVLGVTQLAPAISYTLTVGGIADRAVPPNTLSSQQVAFEFVSGLVDDFEEGGRLVWSPKTASRWAIDTDDSDHSYHLNTSDFSNDGDMLGEYSLLQGQAFTEFVLTVSVRSPEAGNSAADAAIVFGFEDAANYCYVMLNATAKWCQLFQVKNGVRTALATGSEPMLPFDHYAVTAVTVSNSSVAVSVDGVAALSASLGEVVSGAVGLGSYNDAAYFDDFSVASVGTGVVSRTQPPSQRYAVRAGHAPVRMFDLLGRSLAPVVHRVGTPRSSGVVVVGRGADTSRMLRW